MRAGVASAFMDRAENSRVGVSTTNPGLPKFCTGRSVPARRWSLIGFSAARQQCRLRCISELEQVVIVGEVACILCRDSPCVTPRTGGEATELAGHRITIYRKQPDGRWLLARDVNTLSPVAS